MKLKNQTILSGKTINHVKQFYKRQNEFSLYKLVRTVFVIGCQSASQSTSTTNLLFALLIFMKQLIILVKIRTACHNQIAFEIVQKNLYFTRKKNVKI